MVPDPLDLCCARGGGAVWEAGTGGSAGVRDDGAAAEEV